jgi:hypothetical protein
LGVHFHFGFQDLPIKSGRRRTAADGFESVVDIVPEVRRFTRAAVIADRIHSSGRVALWYVYPRPAAKMRCLTRALNPRANKLDPSPILRKNKI